MCVFNNCKVTQEKTISLANWVPENQDSLCCFTLITNHVLYFIFILFKCLGRYNNRCVKYKVWVLITVTAISGYSIAKKQ